MDNQFTPLRTPGIYKIGHAGLNERLAEEGFEIVTDEMDRGRRVVGYKSTEELRNAIEIFWMDHPRKPFTSEPSSLENINITSPGSVTSDVVNRSVLQTDDIQIKVHGAGWITLKDLMEFYASHVGIKEETENE